MSVFSLNRRQVLAHGLKAARLHAQLGPKEAAFLLSERGVMCHREMLLAWEHGKDADAVEPHASDLPEIATVYGCSIAELFAQTDAQQYCASELKGVSDSRR